MGYVGSNEKFGFDYLFSSGKSPQEAVDEMIKNVERTNRDPEIARQKKVAQMEETIRKLQAVIIAMPPYRPNRELTNGTLTVPDPVAEV